MRNLICMLLSMLVFAELASAQGICPHYEDSGIAALQASTQGIELNFPNKGTMNAFVIFVQHRDDAFDNYLLTDEDTEWPSDRSAGPGRLLPAWAGTNGEAFLAPPGANPSGFAEGSLSQFYHLMSNGQFTLTGDVYPEFY